MTNIPDLGMDKVIAQTLAGRKKRETERQQSLEERPANVRRFLRALTGKSD